MSTDWQTTFNSLSSTELDKLAVLRIMECTNGIIQYMYRDDAPDALSLEETREAMKFSMSSIKQMQIVLDNETINFDDNTKEIMGRVRDLYVRGMKQNDDVAYEEFLVASKACMIACGADRLQVARDKLFSECYSMPPHTWDYGLGYCFNFMKT